ncbi:Caspase domain-containing protein [Hydrobacter penzbergensis]|uniref:Caspase domain-containing protein n=2 Tax=Hydrobacter penzbergensis TaxID=1235997 RepID=A0A8X8IFJ1_9BACT|nr:caspase family protein [Hydrobacter penzbergensis]SDX00980.1 Caspase domain-containing protein [Hydrobacter penzbergensis]
MRSRLAISYRQFFATLAYTLFIATAAAQDLPTRPEILFRHGISNRDFSPKYLFPAGDTLIVAENKNLLFIDRVTGMEFNNVFFPDGIFSIETPLIDKSQQLLAAVGDSILLIKSVRTGLTIDTVMDIGSPHISFGGGAGCIFYSSSNKLYKRIVNRHRSEQLCIFSFPVKSIYWIEKEDLLTVVIEKKGSYGVVFLDSAGKIIAEKEIIGDYVKVAGEFIYQRQKNSISVSRVELTGQTIGVAPAKTVPIAFNANDSSSILSPDGRFLAITKKIDYYQNGLRKNEADSVMYLYLYNVSTGMMIGKRKMDREMPMKFDWHGNLLYYQFKEQPSQSALQPLPEILLASFNPISKKGNWILSSALPNRRHISCFDYSQTAKRLAIQTSDENILVIDLTHGWQLTLANLKAPGGISSDALFNSKFLKFSASGKYLVSYTNNEIRIYGIGDSLQYLTAKMTAPFANDLQPTDEDSIFLVRSAEVVYRLNIFQGGIRPWLTKQKTKINIFDPEDYSFHPTQLIKCSGNVFAYVHAENSRKGISVFDTEGPKDTISSGYYSVLDFYDARSGRLIKSAKANWFAPGRDTKGRYTKSYSELYYISAGPDHILRGFSKNFAYSYSLKDLSLVSADVVSFSGNYKIGLENSNLVFDPTTTTLYSDSTKQVPLRDFFDQGVEGAFNLEGKVAVVDRDRFFSLTGSGILELRDGRFSERRLNLVTYPGSNDKYNDLLVVSNYGFFDGNNRVLDQFYWRAKDRYYTYDNFYSSFFKPGLLSRAFNNKLSYALPSINLFLRLPGLSNMLATRQASITNKGTQKIICFKNAPVLDGPMTDSIYEVSDDPDCRLYVRLPKDVSSNELEEMIQPDIDSTYYFTHNIKGNLYVFCLAVGDYPRSSNLPSLSGSKGSVDSLINMFKVNRNRFKNVFEDVIILPPLLDSNATRARFYSLFAKTTSTLRPQDMLFVYLNGHGIIPAQTELFHFFGYDGINGNTGQINASTFNTAQLVDIVSGSVSMRNIVFVDACQSGGIGDSFSKVGEAGHSCPSPYPSVSAAVASSLPIQSSNQFSTESLLVKIISEAFRETSTFSQVSFKQIIEKIRSIAAAENNKLLQTPVIIYSGPDFPFMNAGQQK